MARLEQVVGAELSAGLSDADLEAFSALVDSDDDLAAGSWLTTHRPDYRVVVFDQVRTVARQLLEGDLGPQLEWTRRYQIAKALNARYMSTREGVFLDEAITLLQRLLTDQASAPDDLRTSMLISLANAMTKRMRLEHEQEGDLALLIDTQRALTQRPDNSSLARSLMILSDRLQQRADRVGESDPAAAAADVDEAVDSARQAVTDAPMTCARRR